MRQSSAGKLATCWCDGTEEFQCQEIRDNTDSLCFYRDRDVEDAISDNEVKESRGMMKNSSLLVVISMLCSVVNTSLGESVRTMIQEITTR